MNRFDFRRSLTRSRRYRTRRQGQPSPEPLRCSISVMTKSRGIRLRSPTRRVDFLSGLRKAVPPRLGCCSAQRQRSSGALQIHTKHALTRSQIGHSERASYDPARYSALTTAAARATPVGVDEQAIRRAALVTVRQAILEPFPPGPERSAWLRWAAGLAKKYEAAQQPQTAYSQGTSQADPYVQAWYAQSDSLHKALPRRQDVR